MGHPPYREDRKGKEREGHPSLLHRPTPPTGIIYQNEIMTHMAWEVAIVVDPQYDVSALDGLTRQMPVWAVSTPERERAAAQIQANSHLLWSPEPSFMLFEVADSRDPDASCLSVLDSVNSHHPQVSALQLIGATGSDSLAGALRELGYLPAEGSFHPGLRVRKPLEKIPGVRNLILDASHWNTTDDVYDAFFRVVGAPEWHGRNSSALHDSIITGNVNKVDVPYRLIIQNYNRIGDGAREMAQVLVQLIHENEAGGCPVSVQF